MPPQQEGPGASAAGVARGYLAAQSAMIMLWWASLALFPAWRGWFTDAAVGGDGWLVWFMPADALTAGGGLVAARRWHRYAGRVALICCLIGISTQTLACYTVPFRTGGSAGWPGAIAMTLAALGTLACCGQMIAGHERTRSIFRPAPTTASRQQLAWQTVRQAAVLWVLFLLILPATIALLERAAGFTPPRSGMLCLLGILLFVGGSSLNIGAAVAMIRDGHGTPLPMAMANTLVLRGPYRWIRNPMAVGGLTQGLGVATLIASPLTAACVVIGGVVWHVLIRPAEERDLTTRFGSAYLTYKSRVRCWLPRVFNRNDAEHSRGSGGANP